MSLVKDVIESVARKGEITHEFTVKGLQFVIRSLATEEQILADGMVDTGKIRKKYGAENLMTLSDTIQKYRTIAMVALATKTINGKSPVDEEASLEEQYKQRQEFVDELMSLGSAFMDNVIREYNKLGVKEREFFSDVDENIKK